MVTPRPVARYFMKREDYAKKPPVWYTGSPKKVLLFDS